MRMEQLVRVIECGERNREHTCMPTVAVLLKLSETGGWFSIDLLLFSAAIPDAILHGLPNSGVGSCGQEGSLSS